MCTVSVIPDRTGLRLVVNRDEDPRRAGSLAPAWRTRGSRALASDRRALWPTDPQGGGTWVAASDRGLALALLNRNAPEPAAPLPTDLISRGRIIPELIWSDDACSAVRDLDDLELSRFAPFRLLAADASHPTTQSPGHAPTPRVRIFVATWDRQSLTIEGPLAAPNCLASSGLGDHLVTPRLDLFSQMLGHAPTPESQDAFHTHHWPDRPHLSVMMSRPGARTVSVTTLTIHHDDQHPQRLAGVRMTVRNVAPTPTPHAQPHTPPSAQGLIS